MHYILDRNGNPQPCADVMAWAHWFEKAQRSIALNERDGVKVSTVFLGLDHRFGGNGPPLVFETMIFGGENDGEQDRYSTKAEALTGHEALCRLAFGEEPRDA